MQACSCEARVKERLLPSPPPPALPRPTRPGKLGDSEGVESEQPSGFDLDQPLCEISSGPRLSATVYNLHLPLLASQPLYRVHVCVYVTLAETIPSIATTSRCFAQYTYTWPSCMYERVKLAKSFVLFFVSTGTSARAPAIRV